jgi:hypothetical protein
MPKASAVAVPYLDPSVQHVGISRLRAFNVTQLGELDKTLVIQDNDKPLAVLMRYENFMAMQEGAKQWEYKIDDYVNRTKMDAPSIERVLNSRAEEGFELVRMDEEKEKDVYKYRFIFKRQKA